MTSYIINKKYKLLDKIGEGSFGSIYKAHNIRTEEYVAVKVEPIKNATKLLKNESIIYHYLNNVKGMPSVKWFGKDDKNYYMVINLLGKSLQDLKDKHFNFPLKIVLQIGIQMIQLLQKIHDKGLIHRDIKPENFLFGLNNESKYIYMIDFGFCKSFIQDDKHIPHKKTNNLIGSHTYASVNAHNFIELSRRDDLESLGYILIYFYLGTLSWQDISELSKNGNNGNNVKDESSIIYLKTQIVENGLIPQVLTNYMRYVRALEFEEKPDYELLIETFLKQIELFKNS
jgi:serine/threonine protein kinase